jgi:uncharacterized repeat protein (TIGR01451 family)
LRPARRGATFRPFAIHKSEVAFMKRLMSISVCALACSLGVADTAGAQVSADISVTKADTPDPVAPGGNITYTITVSNAGPSDAANVVATDTLPASTTFAGFVSISQGSAAFLAGTVTATFGTIPSGGMATVVFAVTVDAGAAGGTVISNPVAATTTSSDPNTANNTDTATTLVAVPTADISVNKTDSPDPATPGANVTYVVSAANGGPDEALNVTATDVIPAGLTFAGFISITQGSAAFSAGTMTANFGTIPSGGSANVQFAATVGAGVAPGTVISNTVTAATSTSDPNGTNNSDTETTLVVGAVPTIGPWLLAAAALLLLALPAIGLRRRSIVLPMEGRAFRSGSGRT